MTTDHREHLSEAELGVLKHVREHSRGEPSAAVDGLILAAASHAAQQPVAPSGWQRMQHWLFAAGHGQRWNWSVGVAGVASLALGLCLTWRQLAQSVAGFDHALPLAIQPAAPKAMQQAKIESVELKKQQPAAPVVAGEALADKAERRQQSNLAPALQGADRAAPAKRIAPTNTAEVAAPRALAEMADAAAPATSSPTLREELLQVLALRRSGETVAADAALADLAKRYPQQDVAAQLQQLERDLPQSPGQ